MICVVLLLSSDLEIPVCSSPCSAGTATPTLSTKLRCSPQGPAPSALCSLPPTLPQLVGLETWGLLGPIVCPEQGAGGGGDHVVPGYGQGKKARSPGCPAKIVMGSFATGAFIHINTFPRTVVPSYGSFLNSIALNI